MTAKLEIVIYRHELSLQPKRNPAAPDDWGNNDANNSLDLLELVADGTVVFQCSAQTVSNMPGGRFLDTLAAGGFDLRCFVEQREFWPRIHGITNALTLDGQLIDHNCVAPDVSSSGAPANMSRWLMHDWQKLRNTLDENNVPYPQGSDTRVGWSEGCIVLADADLANFNDLLDDYEVKPDELISGMILKQAA